MTKIVGRLLNSICIIRNLLFWKKNLLYFNSDMSLSMELLYISYHSFMVYSNTFKKFNIQIRNTVLKYQKSFTNYSKHWWWDKIKPYFQTFWIKNKIMWEPLWLSHENLRIFPWTKFQKHIWLSCMSLLDTHKKHHRHHHDDVICFKVCLHPCMG